MARNIYYWTIYVLCLTAYVTECTFYIPVQGKVHLQFTLASQSPLFHLFCLQILTAYVNDSTFYTAIQGNVHLQFTLANQSPLLHFFYLQILYYGIPTTICSTLLMAEKGLNYSVSQKKSNMSTGHT